MSANLAKPRLDKAVGQGYHEHNINRQSVSKT